MRGKSVTTNGHFDVKKSHDIYREIAESSEITSGGYEFRFLNGKLYMHMTLPPSKEANLQEVGMFVEVTALG